MDKDELEAWRRQYLRREVIELWLPYAVPGTTDFWNVVIIELLLELLRLDRRGLSPSR